MGEERHNGVDFLGRPDDRRHPNREAWPGRSLGLELDSPREGAVLELRRRVRVQVDEAADMEMVLSAATSLIAASKGAPGSGRCPATTSGRSTRW